VEYLDDDAELQLIAAAFLAWQRTWVYQYGGSVFADYTAAKESLQRRELDEKHIDTLFAMKNEWTANHE